MNKYFRLLAAFLIVATLFGGFLGCKQEPEIRTEIKYVEQEGGSLKITLTPNTIEKTSQDVVIVVAAESTHTIKAIAYKL